jgi:hypothetical protein
MPRNVGDTDPTSGTRRDAAQPSEDEDYSRQAPDATSGTRDRRLNPESLDYVTGGDRQQLRDRLFDVIDYARLRAGSPLVYNAEREEARCGLIAARDSAMRREISPACGGAPLS